MNLDATAVDEQLGWHAIDPGRGGIGTLGHAELGPSPKSVVEGLLRSIDRLRAVAPAPAALQGMNDPGQHSPVIDAGNTARLVRQQRLNDRPFPVRQFVASPCHPKLLPEALNQSCSLPASQFMSLRSSLGRSNYCLASMVQVGSVKVGNFCGESDKLNYGYILTSLHMAQKAPITRQFALED